MIDLNCDVGESFGVYQNGNEEHIFPYISSANIACGFHAGDAHVMQKTVQLAKEHGIAVGAHPGFQDLVGFGRRNMGISPKEAYDITLYQIGALSAFCIANGVKLSHVKPHGAFYNLAAVNGDIALAIAEAVYDFDSSLFLYGLAGSKLIEAGEKVALQTVSEVFADRTYQCDGTLTPRSQKNAIIHDVELAIAQVVQMVNEGTVRAVTGEVIPIRAESICVHGDNEHALLFVKELRDTLENQGIAIQAKR